MGNLGDPFYPVHPGELIKDELEYRGISQKAFALKFGVSSDAERNIEWETSHFYRFCPAFGSCTWA
jgi:hypothetical protein